MIVVNSLVHSVNKAVQNTMAPFMHRFKSLIDTTLSKKSGEANQDTVQEGEFIGSTELTLHTTEEIIEKYGDNIAIKEVLGKRYYYILDDRQQVQEIWENDDENRVKKVSNMIENRALKGYYFLENSFELEPIDMDAKVYFQFDGKEIIIHKKNHSYHINYDIDTYGLSELDIKRQTQEMQTYCETNIIQILAYYYDHRHDPNIVRTSPQPNYIEQSTVQENNHVSNNHTPLPGKLMSLLEKLANIKGVNIESFNTIGMDQNYIIKHLHTLLGFLEKRQQSINKYLDITQQLKNLFKKKNSFLKKVSLFVKKTAGNSHIGNKQSAVLENMQQKDASTISKLTSLGSRIFSNIQDYNKHIPKLAKNLQMNINFESMYHKIW